MIVKIIGPVGEDPDGRTCQIMALMSEVIDRLIRKSLEGGWQPHETLLGIITPAIYHSVHALGLDMTREFLTAVLGAFGSPSTISNDVRPERTDHDA